MSLQRCNSRSGCQKRNKEPRKERGVLTPRAEGAIPDTERLWKHMADFFGWVGEGVHRTWSWAQCSSVRNNHLLETEPMEKHHETVYTQFKCPYSQTLHSTAMLGRTLSLFLDS